MDIIHGYEPLDIGDGQKSEKACETPGTHAIETALQQLDDMDLDGICMAMPGVTSTLYDVYPHSQQCEQRLLKAASLIEEAVRELTSAKAGQ